MRASLVRSPIARRLSRPRGCRQVLNTTPHSFARSQSPARDALVRPGGCPALGQHSTRQQHFSTPFQSTLLLHTTKIPRRWDRQFVCPWEPLALNFRLGPGNKSAGPTHHGTHRTVLLARHSGRQITVTVRVDWKSRCRRMMRASASGRLGSESAQPAWRQFQFEDHYSLARCQWGYASARNSAPTSATATVAAAPRAPRAASALLWAWGNWHSSSVS
jgi:hypothetical protein